MFLLNAFSLSMLTLPASAQFTEVSAAEAAEMARSLTSAVGHADTAGLFATLLGQDVPVNRVSVSLHPGQVALVGQYIGPRLQEGATTLPEGARVAWVKVEVT